jgi:TM2 domain-containing membrane protein YozV
MNNGKYKLVLEDLGQLKKKSTIIAGISSLLIPGSGYIYSGHTKTGISSLLFNSLFAFATYSNFRTGNAGMGILTGLFGLAFYISNIQGSVKSVERYNSMNYENIINRFEEQTIIYH